MTDSHVTVVNTSQKMLDLKEQWDELWTNSSGCYLQEFAFCWQTWKCIHEPQRRGLRVAVLRQNGRLIALLPTAVVRKGPWTLARSLGVDAAEGCNMLVRRGYDRSPATASLLWQGFLRQVRPHYVNLSFVRTDSLLHAAVTQGTGYRILATQSDQIVCANLGGASDWETYKAALSKSFRSQVARKRRRLAELGVMTFERVTSGIPFYIDWLLVEKRKWAELAGKKGPWLYAPNFRECLIRYAAGSPHAHVFVLKLDGRPVAASLVAVGPAICNGIIASFDKAYGKVSPGNILDEFWMEYVFTNYARDDGRHLDVDFGAGKEINKLHWSQGHVVPSVSYRIATSLWGAVPYYAKSLLQRRTKPVDDGTCEAAALRGPVATPSPAEA